MSAVGNIEQMGIGQMADVIEGSTQIAETDMGLVSFLHCRNEVMGDFITFSTAEGRCGVIRL